MFSTNYRDSLASKTVSIISAFVLVVGVFPAISFAADTGYILPTSNVQNAGGDSWNSGANAQTDGGGNATSTANGKKHRYAGFDFSSIPDGSTINGIKVIGESWSDDNDCDLGAELSWNGGTSWTIQKTNSLNTSEGAEEFGAHNDDWRASSSWTTSELDALVVRVQAIDGDGAASGSNDCRSASDNVYLDLVRVKVYYTEVEPTGAYTISETGGAVINGLEVDLDGVAGGHPYKGQLNQQSVSIDWDADQNAGTFNWVTATTFDITSSGGSGVNKFFDADWTGNHTFASAGTYTIHVRVHHQNVNGNEGSDVATITIPVTIVEADETAPTFGSAPDIEVETEDGGGTTVNYSIPEATDDVDGALDVTCLPASGSLFAIGTTTVTCSTEDESGNEAATQFDVIVTLIPSPDPTCEEDEIGTYPDCQNDEDGDGIGDDDDNCPEDANPNQIDSDLDGEGNECDEDPFTDFTEEMLCDIYEELNMFPLPEFCNDAPVDTDADNDGIEDADDNCPLDANPGQEDTDNEGAGDGVGDACDTPDEDGQNENPAPQGFVDDSPDSGHINAVCENNEDDDNDGLYDMNDPDCSDKSDSSESTEVGGIGNGEVAGASTCSALISTFMRKNMQNDEEEVKKLQNFLNTELGLSLEVNGIFDDATEKAVNEFQSKYMSEVLTPWGITDSTGYVFKTTTRWINKLACPTLDIPMPELN